MSLVELVTNTEYIRREWLNTLKVGDEVAVSWLLGNHKTYKKVRVVKVTPSGRIKTDYGEKDPTVWDFGLKGEARAPGGVWTSVWYTLEPWTETIEKYLARKKLENSVMSYLSSQCDRTNVVARSDDFLLNLLTTLRSLRSDA